MKIVVRGMRSDRAEWEAVQQVPREELPPLSPEQRRVVEQLRIREEDYQRSVLAGKRTGEKLLRKTEWFAKLLQRDLAARAPEAAIESVALDTWKERLEIAIRTNGTTLPLHVAENVVDDLFDLGSTHAERKVAEMLDECLNRLGVS